MFQIGILHVDLMGHFMMFISKYSMHLITYNRGHNCDDDNCVVTFL